MEQDLKLYNSDLRAADGKIQTEESSNECNQCNYASARTGDLRKHLKTHSGEKSNKCNQCNYASSRAGTLREHLRTHSGKSQTNATNVIMRLLR